LICRCMDDPIRYTAGRDRWLTLAAIVALALVIGGIAYEYSDDLTELAQSLTSGRFGHAQSRSLHY
jgi:hypothetical protein